MALPTSPTDTPTILPIPHLSPSATALPSLVTKYKTLRLSALQLEPTAFSSTYDREKQFSHETWVSRVQNSQGTTYIALNSSQSEPTSTDQEQRKDNQLQQLLENEWVGQITLLGPEVLVDQNEREKPWMPFLGGWDKERRRLTGFDMDRRQRRSDAYMVMGMFVMPNWRGRGVGRRLIEEALRGICSEKTAVVVVAMAEQDNHTARRLYDGCGFGVLDEAVEVQSRGEESRVVAMGRQIDT